jgi:hypothetical protein
MACRCCGGECREGMNQCKEVRCTRSSGVGGEGG